MKIKTINKIIQQKVADWLGSIDNDSLRNDVKGKVIVTGGCITSMLQGDDVNDFDIYFKDAEITERIARYYVDIANLKHDESITVTNDDRVRIIISSGIVGEQPEERDDSQTQKLNTEKDQTKDYDPIHLSENAITLSGKVQLITRFYGDPEEIHKNYDFIHCTNYWTFDTKLVTNKRALESILTKELHYVGSLYPICSIIRTRKFIGRGWRIHAGQYLKMCFQVSELNLRDIKVLRDQLTGVDSTYFHMLIQALESKMSGEKEINVSVEYLSEIIDRIFD